MPISINLLADEQATEDLRRRDPVKRSIWIAVVLVALLMIYWSSLEVKLMTYNVRLSNLEGSLNSQTNKFKKIQENQAKLYDAEQKLGALQRLAANRFLSANLLNALQQSTVDGIQLIRLKVDQGYSVTEEVKSRTLDDGRVIPAKPAVSSEKIVLNLEAKDTSLNPGGDLVAKFKETLAESPYFKANKISTNAIFLKHLDSPLIDTESGKPYVIFSLECRYPEKTR